MTSLSEARQIVAKKYKHLEVTLIFQTPDKWVFALEPKGRSDKAPTNDPFYYVSKTNGECKEYAHLLDLENFKKGIRNPIFSANRGK